MNRRDQIDRMRKMQMEHDPFDRPFRTVFTFGLLALLFNLIFWGALILMVIFGLSFII